MTSFHFNFLKITCTSAFIYHSVAFSASTDYAASPNQGTTTSPPQVMLVMPVDHQLFKRSYSDYTDLDGDSVIDTNYKDTFDYAGYFDSSWCYAYSSSDNRYKPVAQSTGTNGHFCTDNTLAPWSGNFLNWVTMSRLDILRNILYGGFRSIDTATTTVLQKASSSRNLSASWAKVYAESDVDSYTPYSSAITLCNVNDSGSSLRIADGSFPRWATTEVTQCQWGNPFSPAASAELATHKVNVEACVVGKDASNQDRCKQYDSGVPKPYGLLQEYGEGNEIHFGLITGSYDTNSAGGVLRRNTQQFSGKVDPTQDEINLTNGTFNTAVQGIIHNINAIGLTAWRNPISEIYLEAVRYFSGSTSGSTAFSADDSGRGMTNPAWTPPLSTANACASCSIILISSGTNEFDRDNLGSSSDITGMTAAGGLNSRTDEVGDFEYGGSFSGSYYHGGSNEKCTTKSLTLLSDAIGICPEAPSRQGGYGVAGLSYHARISDLRTDLDGIQNIKTYTVQLADNLPSLRVAVGSDVVSFQPISSRGFFKDLVVDLQTADGSRGKYTFIWEDCAEGCDNDYDASSSIEYCVATACSPALNANQIKVTSRFESKFTTASYTFSHSIFGTNNDGTATPHATGPGGGASQGQGTPVSQTYTVTGASTGILPKPLRLAAKYGGFTDMDNDTSPNHDSNADGIPDNDNREWDVRNNATGALGEDGIPDNYFLANNPSLLKEQFELVFKDIATRISSGASAALVSNSASGVGTAIQALFRPKVTIRNREINWVGLLHSLFVDAKGHFREDTNNNQALDDYTIDKIVTLYFDSTSSSTVIQRYTSNDDGDTLIPDGGAIDLTELDPVWDAREELMSLSNVTAQRSYYASSDQGRHIFTWLDADNDGLVSNTEVHPFTATTFSTTNNEYLGVATTEASKLVNFIRGEEQAGYRSRSVDYNNDGGALDVWRLGDIIHSNPVSVSKPRGYYTDRRSFDVNDNTFIDFQTFYKDRRQVVYVGANDGMIHAFNAGFWDDDNQLFDLSPSGETAHPLGSEIWAYTPMNLLPHLRWLSEPDYPHVYYMDGEPLIFDANIFAEDVDHPKGWGTVLVMGMRLGGGPIDVTVAGTPKTMRSAYVVLDITNPEKPPKLLAEITHPELGFTTNRPVVIQRRMPDSTGDYSRPSENNWYLAFGNGPTGTGTAGIRQALDDATSDQNMKVFIYDLRNRSFLPQFNPNDSGLANAYAGSMSTVDWDLDYYDDAVYFGSVETAGNLSGKLLRINLAATAPLNWTLSILTNPMRPITARPTTVTNSQNERWIFAGTGREITRDDSRSTEQEFFFGVKEPQVANVFSYGTVPFNELVDTTDVQVEADGDLVTGFTVPPATTVNSFDSLISTIKTKPGWKNRLAYDGINPSSKSISSAANAFALLLFTEYQPPADQCLVDGISYLQAIHYQTGTAIPASIQKVLTPDGFTGDTVSTRRISLGAGLAPAPVIHQGSDGRTSIIIQGGAGNISSTDLEYSLTDSGRQSWWQILKIPR